MKKSLVFEITMEDVQAVAIQKIGRKLNSEEMQRVKKSIEWGYVDWEETVRFALKNLDD